jgi:hypothetical protein
MARGSVPGVINFNSIRKYSYPGWLIDLIIPVDDTVLQVPSVMLVMLILLYQDCINRCYGPKQVLLIRIIEAIAGIGITN